MSGARTLRVLDPGLLSTVQDLGRSGAGAMGVSPSGAVDRFSARAANRLAGNADSAALVETTLNGASFEIGGPCLVAVTGARAPLSIDGRSRSSWRSWPVGAGSRVVVGPAEHGLRSYLAVSGGVVVPLVMGSAATDIGAGFGGRMLAKGDELEVGDFESESASAMAYPRDVVPSLRSPFVLRAMVGPDLARVGDAGVAALLDRTYRASARSSRQGLRLEGEPLDVAGATEGVSAGVCAGCVQVAGDGLPIVMLAEHQTTGGYPVALCLITADVSLAAQVRPGDSVRFERVDRRCAREALEASSARLRALRAIAADGDASFGDDRLTQGFFEGATS